MKKPASSRSVLLCAIVLLASFSPAFAQFGIGGGVAALGDNIADAGVKAEKLLNEEGLAYGDIGGIVGFYGTLQFRGSGAIRLVGDVSYVFFPEATVAFVGGNVEDTSATFDVGSSLIPLAFGVDLALPASVVRPYIGAQLTYTVFNRTLTFIQGDPRFNTPEVRNQWEGENHVGAAVRGGASFVVGSLALDAGFRYNLADLFTRDADAEPMSYMQLGVVVLFGSPTGSDGDEPARIDRSAR